MTNASYISEQGLTVIRHLFPFQTVSPFLVIILPGEDEVVIDESDDKETKCRCAHAAAVSAPIGLTCPMWLLPLISFVIKFIPDCDNILRRRRHRRPRRPTEYESLSDIEMTFPSFTRDLSFSEEPFALKNWPLFAGLCFFMGIFVPLGVYFSCKSVCDIIYDDV